MVVVVVVSASGVARVVLDWLGGLGGRNFWVRKTEPRREVDWFVKRNLS